MGSILGDSHVKEAICKIAPNANRSNLTVEAFYNHNLVTHLHNLNHQIIQGRRGTGKTHILSVLQSELEDPVCHCIFFDCSTTGRIASVSDESFPENYRAVELIRDFISELHADFLKYYNESLSTGNNCNELRSLLEHLWAECNATEEIIQQYEETRNRKYSLSNNTDDTHKFSVTSLLSGEFQWQKNQQKSKEFANDYTFGGFRFDTVRFPNVAKCLEQMGNITGKKFVILIDEWSSLPLEIQPHFAEFLHRSVLPVKCVTVKIAAITGRTRYYIRKENSNVVYGMDIGPEIRVDLVLDDIYMFDKNPRKVFNDLMNILLTHLKAQGVIRDMSVEEFMSVLFADLRSAILLARASEGNPRDFLSILNICVSILDGIGNSDSWIDSDTILDAAEKWYVYDKVQMIKSSGLHQKLLNEIFTYVVDKKNTRGFVIEESYLTHPAIQPLIDARLLHIVKRSQHYFQLNSQNYALLVLDFGTYISYLIAKRDIHLFTSDTFENEIFPHYDFSLPELPLYPFDRNRQFYFCLLEPELRGSDVPTFDKIKSIT